MRKLANSSSAASCPVWTWDIRLSVEGDQLKISAERRQEERTDRRTEFRYGSFSRILSLPAGVDPEEIKADYDAGVLTVRIPARARASKEIPVARRGQ